MLRNNPELNITEISDRIGFSSSRYFSKCFKDIYHVSPLAYRKGENGGEESTEDSEETSLILYIKPSHDTVCTFSPLPCTSLYTRFHKNPYL